MAEDAKTKGVSMSELAEKVSSRIAEHESTNVDKTKIMAIYKDESKNLKPAPVKSVETEKLREFSDRRQYARKKTDAKKRLVIYEFARIPPTVQVEIDEAIKKLWISSLPPTKWMLGGGEAPSPANLSHLRISLHESNDYWCRLVRIPLYSITDWHRSPISDSHPFDQPGT
ncbi:hypothetical protein O5553_26805 [Escherichia coli]|nr:hypothetical protein [Escherichia coli]